MPTSDHLKRLFRAFRQRSDPTFLASARALIQEEREKGHRLLARDLEGILENGQRPSGGISAQFADVPVDKERGLPLVHVERPDVPWEQVVLTPELAGMLDDLIQEYRKRDVLNSYGARYRGKVLFFGPPGCGKTVTARMLSSVLDLPLLYVRFDSVVSSYLGETAANIRKVFDYAERGHWVVLLDEFDAIGKQRDNALEHGELKRVVNSLLQLMDNFTGESILIAATNHEFLLDSALWRRFDEICLFEQPNVRDRKKLAEKFLRGMKHLKKHEARIAKALQGMSGGDVERVCLDAVKAAVLAGRSEILDGDVEVALTRERYRRRVSGRTAHRSSEHQTPQDNAERP